MEKNVKHRRRPPTFSRGPALNIQHATLESFEVLLVELENSRRQLKRNEGFLTLSLPVVTKTEFVPTISIQYQADK